MTHPDVPVAGVVKGCSVRGCRSPGYWKPAFIIPRVDGKEALMELHLRVCDVHRATLEPREYLDIPNLWNAIEQEFLKAGLHPPLKEQAQLKWERWNPEIVLIDG